MKYLRYIWYVAQHKFWVFVYGCQLGIPLLALLHDNSKLLPSEFFPYVEWFEGKKTKADKRRFDAAVKLHKRRNKHHPEYWMVHNIFPHRTDSADGPLPMPERYIREMVADWRSVGMCLRGNSDALPWYRTNRKKLRLHPWTQERVEALLGYHV